MQVLNNKKVLFGWTMYDWANSVFSLTITTAIFPIFYEKMAQMASLKNGLSVGDSHYLEIFGKKILATAAYSYSIALAFLIIALISPILSGIADSGGFKKRFMQFFVYLGSAACVALYFFDDQNVSFGLMCFILGAIGFAGSIVFYNSFLPLIATEDKYDSLSARGFSMGYIGSVLLLIVNLMVIIKPEWFFAISEKVNNLIASGLSEAQAEESARDYFSKKGTQIAFLTVGIWWAAFAQITFFTLPKEPKTGTISKGVLTAGFLEISKTFKEVNKLSDTKKYLLSFFFISMGLQTVMYLATLFGSKELNMASSDLIGIVLVIQLIAILGSFGFSKISSKIGNIYTLIIGNIFWIGICLSAYAVTNTTQFFILAAVVGLVMGGMQSLLRSTFAKIIPDNTLNHASFFSFFDVTEKVAIVIGTFAYGYIEELTGSMRMSALALGVFFIIGILFLVRIKNFKIHKG